MSVSYVIYWHGVESKCKETMTTNNKFKLYKTEMKPTRVNSDQEVLRKQLYSGVTEAGYERYVRVNEATQSLMYVTRIQETSM